MVIQLDTFHMEEEFRQAVIKYTAAPNIGVLTGPAYSAARANYSRLKALSRMLEPSVVAAIWERHGPRHADGKLWAML